MEPATMLALGGVASNILGGIFGSKSRKKDRAIATDQFNQQMDHSIERRVKDAKRAGVHPIFALGGNVGASPTMSVGGAGSPGQTAATGISRALTSLAAEKIRAETTREIAAAELDSARARAVQYGASSGRDSITGQRPFVPGASLSENGVNILPAEVVHSNVRGVEAGMHPATKDVKLPDGRKIRVLSETLQADELNQVKVVFDLAKYKLTDGMTAVRKFLGSKGIATYPYTDKQIKSFIAWASRQPKSKGKQARRYTGYKPRRNR